jgi:autotransporter translocation and assembly factor TamB
LKRWWLRAVPLVVGLALVALLALSVLALFLSSEAGRQRLLVWLVPEVNRHIAGRVAVAELAELGLSSVVLRGVSVQAPAGNEVLAVGELRLEPELSRLLHGEWVVTRLAIERARVDLSAPDDPERGLLGAFASRDGAASEAPEQAGPAPLPTLRIALLSVRELHVELPVVPALGLSSLQHLALDASFSSADSAALELQRLETELWRASEELGRVTLQASLNSAGAPSKVTLDGTLGKSALRAGVVSHYARGEDWRQAPLRAAVALRSFDAGTLARLLADPELAQAFPGALTLELDVDKPRAAPGTRLAVRALPDEASPLPTLSASATLAGEELSELVLELSDEHSNVAVRGHANLAGQARLALEADLDLTSSVQLARAFGVAAPDATGRIQAQLALDRDDSVGAAIRGTVRAERIVLADLDVDSLSAEVDVSGPLTSPRVNLLARWRAAQHGEVVLLPGSLSLRGGPTHYQLAARGGVRELGSFELTGACERRGPSSRLSLDAQGVFRDEPWQIVLLPSDISDAGRIRTPGLKVSFAGQRAELRGRYSPEASELVLELDAVDLRRVLAPFAPGLTLGGSVDGRVSAHGSWARPELRVELEAERLGLEGKPRFDGKLQAELASAAGRLGLQAELREHPSEPNVKPRLRLALDARAEFAPRAPWPDAWVAGEQHVELAIERLDSELLAPLFAEPLPVTLDLHGKVSLHTNHGAPVLDWHAAGEIAERASPQGDAASASSVRRQSVEHHGRYDAGTLKSELGLSDAQGPWLSLAASVDLFPSAGAAPALRELIARGPEWLQRLPTLLEQAAWQLDFDAKQRTFAELRAPGALAQLTQARLWAKGSAQRTAGQEPQARFEVGLDDLHTGVVAADCVQAALRGNALIELADGQLQARISAATPKQDLAQVDAGLRVAYLPWLRGEAGAASALELTARVHDVSLAELPLVCGAVQGRMSASAVLHDVLSTSPQGNLELTIDDFNRGGAEALDLSARAKADAHTLTLDAHANAGGKISRLQASLPVRQRAYGLDPMAPLDVSVELDELPLAPFVHPRGAISYATGSLSGEASARGNLAAPRLAGKLKLNDIAFTATQLAQPLSDVQGEVTFDNDTIVLRKVSARDGEGKLALEGRVDLRAPKGVAGEFELSAQKFPLRMAGEVVATTTARAKLDTLWARDELRLGIRLRGFDTWLESGQQRVGLALEPHPDVRIARDEPAAPDSTASGEAGAETASADKSDERAKPGAAQQRLQIDIDAGEEFWIKRADFSIKLSAKLQVTNSADPAHPTESKTSVNGTIAFDRGYLDLLGKIFEIERGGTLRFPGGDQAIIDLTASYQNRRTQQKLKVHVSGSSTAPQLAFSLDDEVIPVGEAFQVIYGSQSDDDDTDSQAQASQLLGALTAGFVTSNLRRTLGSMAPILMVQPSDEQGGNQIHAGFELDTLIPEFLRGVVTGMYVEGIVSSGKQAEDGSEQKSEHGVLIELYFPYNLVTSGRYGSDATWSVDLGWQP